MQKYIATAIKKDVNNPFPEGETPAVGVDVYVYVKSTGSQAVIYSDNGVTTITQPLQTDANGRVEFYAANGRYNIEYNLPSGVQTDEDIILYDEFDDIATTQEAKDGTNDSKKMTPLKTHAALKQFGVGSSDFTDNAFGNDANNLNKTGSFLLVNAINTPEEETAVFVNNMFINGSQGIGFQIANTQGSGEYFVRSKNSAGLGSGWLKSLTSGNFIFLMNSTGSTIANNAVTSGASLTPPQTGSWRNVSGNDVNNNSYGLFQKV